MFCIKNKIESIYLIKNLNLNRFPEKLFRSNCEKDVIEFLNKYPAKYYAIRDKSKNYGLFKLKVLKDDVLLEIKDYKCFTINVSSYNYVDNQLINGEIEILSSGMVYAQFSCDPIATGRPDDPNCIIINTNIFNSNELNKIPGFDYIYDYFVSHGLVDVIVEFALFDTDVGINNEKIIIYELRTDY